MRLKFTLVTCFSMTYSFDFYDFTKYRISTNYANFFFDFSRKKRKI